MNQSWEDFPVVDIRPSSSTHWQFPGNGWFALFMWAAGPRWVIATNDRTTREPVRHVHESGDGSLSYQDVPFTVVDQSEVDEDMDGVLAHVGLPPRPRGFDWYLRIDSRDRGRVGRIGTRVEASIPSDIDGPDYLPAVRAAMELIVGEELASRPAN